MRNQWQRESKKPKSRSVRGGSWEGKPNAWLTKQEKQAIADKKTPHPVVGRSASKLSISSSVFSSPCYMLRSLLSNQARRRQAALAELFFK
jgi:hypothetical protein